MHDAMTYISEQFKYFRIAANISKYTRKSANLQNKLGRIWEILDPLIALGMNFLIFGILMHRVVPGYPALPWMFIGMGSFTFMKNIIVNGSRQVASGYKLSATMKYPVSIMPTSAAFGYLTEFFIMVGGGFLLAAVFFGYAPSIQWFQAIYYFIAMIVFSLSMALLFSTVIIVFPDFKYLINYIFQLLMYGSGSVISLTQFKIIPKWMIQAQIVNPFFYINEGFRDSVFHGDWFWQKGMFNLSFWLITLAVLILAANLHMKIRDKISDYL
jgi:teichoic acid transport system permease protein